MSESSRRRGGDGRLHFFQSRDEAMMRTRRLQAEIVGEREKVKQLMSTA